MSPLTRQPLIWRCHSCVRFAPFRVPLFLARSGEHSMSRPWPACQVGLNCRLDTPGKAGTGQRVKVPHGVRINHSPRPRAMRGCERLQQRSVSRGVHGLGIEPRNNSFEVSTLLSETEDNKVPGANGEPGACLAGSKTLCTWRSPVYGTWEISVCPSGRSQWGRVGEDE